MYNFTEAQIEKAITKSRGIVSNIAKSLKVDWGTAHNYIKKYNLQSNLQNQRESLLDLAESKLIENISNNDNTAIIFFLKTQGRGRGYNERVEVATTKENVLFDMSVYTDDELSLIDRLMEKGDKTRRAILPNKE